MKKFVYVISILLLGSCLARETYANDFTSNRVGVSYNYENYGSWVGWDLRDDAQLETYGFGVEFMRDFKVLRPVNLFVETGLGANFNFAAKECRQSVDVKDKFTNINLELPINVTYKLPLIKGHLSPFAGVVGRWNVTGKLRTHTGYGADYQMDGKKSYSLYSSKKFDENDWHRFQVLWNVGVTYEYNHFFVRGTFARDFAPTHKNYEYLIGSEDPESYKISASGVKDKNPKKEYLYCLKATVGFTF